MEEDIKILEEFIDAVGEEYEVVKEKQALENLITGYREMEEENRGLRLDRRNLLSCIEAIKHTTPLNMVSNTDYYIQINDNFIPRAKIEEKIEKYKKLGDEFYEKFLETNKTDINIHDAGISCDAKVRVLQELLEE